MARIFAAVSGRRGEKSLLLPDILNELYFRMNKHLVLLGLLLLPLIGSAQRRFREVMEEKDPRNKGKAFLFHITAGGALPGGDLSKRFGADGNLGALIEFTTQNNWLLGAEGHYFFGSKVKENTLFQLRTNEGYIIGNDRLPAQVYPQERGYYIGGHFGRLFTLGEKRSGIRVTLGAGVLRHKIRYQDDNNSVVQIQGDYAKGYDRLTGGLALQQFVGWQHLGKNRRANFIAGFEFQQGFTNTLRDWDFATRSKLDTPRTDLRFGIRLGWILPLYLTKSEEIFY
jgi:hypothetical protein